jgi:hypothetical protein
MKYKSPTTPGLEIEFNHYLIELICLNMNPKLGPRFWSDSEPYDWGNKYRREIRGVHNLLKKIGDISDPLLCDVIIETIQQYKIKSLLAKKTIEKVVRLVFKKIEIKKQTIIQNQPLQTTADGNKQFTDTERNTTLGKLRKLEKHG